MPVIDTTTSTEDLTLTLVSELAATPERVWQLWEDPRQLERWWGPPTWPATFATYEFRPGGAAHYFMTGPDGTKAHGWWQIVAIDAPSRLEYVDGFADDQGEPVDPADIATGVVTIEAADSGTRMTVRTTFRDAEQLDRMMKMGMAEGMQEAMGQIDAVLAA